MLKGENGSFSIKIRRIEEKDIVGVVLLHMRSFQSFFLTFLGERFLTVLYSSFCQFEGSIGYVAENTLTKKIVGVVVGTYAPHGYFKKLLQYRWYRFCSGIIGSIFKNPKIIKRLIRAVFYRGDSPAEPNGNLLMSIFVDLDLQNCGIGRKLIEEYISSAYTCGNDFIFLTTDVIDNDVAISFYKKFGFVVDKKYVTSEGRRMYRFILSLKNEQTVR